MKKYQEGSFQQFWRRDHLITNNIPVSEIKGLYLSEHFSFEEAQKKFLADEEPNAVASDPGKFCNSHQYIKSPLDLAFQYCSNVFSLEDWSFGVRDIQEYRGGLYAGKENSVEATEIYLRCEAYSDCRVIDQLTAWDQGDQLWMRYYYRLVDAKYSLNMPGTLLMRIASFHPFYSRDTKDLPAFVKSSQERVGRQWVGDSWSSFCTRQQMDMHNLKTILETRFGNT